MITELHRCLKATAGKPYIRLSLETQINHSGRQQFRGRSEWGRWCFYLRWGFRLSSLVSDALSAPTAPIFLKNAFTNIHTLNFLCFGFHDNLRGGHHMPRPREAEMTGTEALAIPPSGLSGCHQKAMRVGLGNVFSSLPAPLPYGNLPLGSMERGLK